MISVEEATARIVAAFEPLDSERVTLEYAIGRTLAADALAKADQPPFPSSVMDGYAVRSADQGPRRVIGIGARGPSFFRQGGSGRNRAPFHRQPVARRRRCGPGAGRCPRRRRDGGIQRRALPGKIRPRPGAGFSCRPDSGEPRGHACAPAIWRLLAAGDAGRVEVRRRPVIALAATGDELSRPGEPAQAGRHRGIIRVRIDALIAQWGAMPRNLGILPDQPEAIAALANEKCDLLVTLGGASVGDHDLVPLCAWHPRLRPRFLEDRDAAGQAADLRASGCDAASGPARQSGVEPGLRAAVLASRHRRDAGAGMEAAAQAGPAGRHARSQWRAPGLSAGEWRMARRCAVGARTFRSRIRPC